ncbi:MAG: sugar ABC transporter permease [Candidatus Eisenbacteria bacterium]|uniref:Sugar ABC transporter permease n=1 Tax=Eiseniibacteriota bacterium TaxID=2212470 RepID=A0A538TN80_UNCEI|nr:MAG: sugar ABC transporter permease [Candidatus Eisenbacteria bacterium]
MSSRHGIPDDEIHPGAARAAGVAVARRPPDGHGRGDSDRATGRAQLRADRAGFGPAVALCRARDACATVAGRALVVVSRQHAHVHDMVRRHRDGPRGHLRPAARSVVLVPWALPTAVMALAWGWIFNDSFGVLNDLLAKAGLVHGPVAWLGRPGTAMAAMVVADVWKTTPFAALVVLAGLQGIPRSTLDAARVDGASPAQILWRVVLPLLRPACLVALAFRVAQGFGAFDLPYVMTGGGPGGSTETVSLYAYRSFYRYLDFGFGAATAVEGAGMALLLFAAILWLSGRTREVA